SRVVQLSDHLFAVRQASAAFGQGREQADACAAAGAGTVRRNEDSAAGFEERAQVPQQRHAGVYREIVDVVVQGHEVVGWLGDALANVARLDAHPIRQV